MTVKETKLKGCFILEPKVFEDSRVAHLIHLIV